MRHTIRFGLLIATSLLLAGFGLSRLAPRILTAPAATQEAQAGARRTARRAGGRVNVAAAREMELAAAANAGRQPASLAAADFDSDGVADLVVASLGGAVSLHPGTAGPLHPAGAQAKAGRAANSSDPEPFRPSAQTFNVSAAPDFTFAGDFNADGHSDVLIAARGGNSLHLLAGDGRGRLAPERKVAVGGAITSVAAGETGRADGQTDVAVSVSHAKGARLLVFEHPEGAFKHGPEVFKLSAPAADIAFGNLDGDSYADIALAAGDELTVVQGRGQAYPWDMLKESGVARPAATVRTRRLAFGVAALAAGKFGGARGDSLALLAEDGRLSVLSRPAEEERPASPAPTDEARRRATGAQFTPAGVGAGRFAVLEQRRPQNADAAERRNPDLVDRAAAAKDPREYFRQRQERAAQAAAASTRLSAAERAKAEQETKTERERARAEFVRSLAPRPVALDAFELRAVTSDARLGGAASSNGGARLVVARVSASGTDDLVVFDPAGRQLQIVVAATDAARASGNPQSATLNPQSEVISLDAASAPVAVLPLRLNADALSDLVVLRAGQASPLLFPSAPANTYVVTTTADSGAGSLRRAISDANASAGADLITFQIGGGGLATIAPASQLPDIREAVTIDGTTQPGFAGTPLIEIKGVNVPEGKDGLRINASDCVVRGLVVNEFSSATHENGFSQIGGNGITIFNFAGQSFAGNNIIEGNYLGTDPTGTQDKGNAVGLLVFDSDANIIGGTTPAARNVMSGNGKGELNVPLEESGSRPGVGLVITVGDDHQIKGNYFGTDASGTSRLNNSKGLFLSGRNNLVGGDEAGAGNTISGNGDPRPVAGDDDYCLGEGVSVEIFISADDENLTRDNVFKGNRIGTTPDGTAPLGNCSTGIVFPGPTYTVVGSITETGRNTISGNTFYGIHCRSGFGSVGSEGNFGQCTIVGNNVGTDPTGTQAIPNTVDNPVYPEFIGEFRSAGAIWLDLGDQDIAVVGSPGGTTPGGPCTGFCNLVSGNQSYGGISRIGGGRALVANNHVGTNRAGTAALPNRAGGLFNYFGDTSVGAVFTDEGGNPVRGGNLISGNESDGVFGTFYGSAVVGNLVGTSADGLSAIPNGADGLVVDSLLSQGTIGGTSPLQRNVIAGNTGHGMTLSHAFGFAVLNNHVGVNAAGGPLGNGGSGVHVRGFPACPEDGPPLRTQVGGRGADEGNVIKSNGGAGVLLTVDVNDTQNCRSGSAAAENRDVPIVGNSIAGNGGLGIDLTNTSTDTGDGVTPNDCLDADEGANRVQNYPELLTPTFNPNGTVTVHGALRSAYTESFVIDFYASSAADPSTYGEGERHIGSQTVATDGNGFGEFTFTSALTVPAGQAITATATDEHGNTSEFSCAAGVCTGPVPPGAEKERLAQLAAESCATAIVVNITTDQPDVNTADGRCDVDTSTLNTDECSLRAAIQEANARPGPDRINFDIPGAGVRTITPAAELPHVTETVVVNGKSQHGYANSPLIELSGVNTGAVASGLIFATGSDGSEVLGLTVNRFPFAGVVFHSSGNRLESSYIGLNADGVTADQTGRQASGVIIFGSDNHVGGDVPSKKNVITGNKVHQVLISQSEARNNFVMGNYIGYAANGVDFITTPLAAGVAIQLGAAGNAVGGSAEAARNYILGQRIGVHVTDGAQANTVSRNSISDCRAGVAITEASNNAIGGANQSESNAYRNIIAKNFYGIYIADEPLPAGPTPGPGTPKSAADASAAAQTRDNKVQGNGIGYNGSTDDLGNQVGIFVGTAAGTLIGGSQANLRNYIGGNKDFGILLTERGTRTVVQNNFIGLQQNGNSPVANGVGVKIHGSENELALNFISGNTTAGVIIEPLSGSNVPASRNLLYDNRIGTNFKGDAPVKNGEFGVVVSGTDNDIGTQTQRNLISGNDGNGITLYGDGNRVVNNLIGTDTTGTAALKNEVCGVAVHSSSNEIISNTISGNGAGVCVFRNPADTAPPGPNSYPAHNVIQQNNIGTNGKGTAKVPNATYGLTLQNGANNNRIGGLDADGGTSPGNVISGNTVEGIVIGRGPVAGAIPPSLNTIQGNFIGTNRSAAPGLGNGGAGISISAVAAGQPSTIADNTIAGNGGFGIFAKGVASTPPPPKSPGGDASPLSDFLPILEIIGNLIGGANGGLAGVVKPLPNISGGIHLDDAGRVLIGGERPNIIVGNDGPGILIEGADATNNVVNAAFIGTDDKGTPGLGNDSHGIHLTDGATRNVIGGPEPGSGNTIINNGGAGVHIDPTAGHGNLVDPNVIHSNAGLGIDLGALGVTANDPGDSDPGPNRLQNFPEIVGRSLNSDSELIVSYRVNSAPGNADYGAQGIYVEFFKSDAGGEGEKFLGSDRYTAADYNNGSPAAKEVNLGPLSALGINPDDPLTATATDAGGNTSEFTPPVSNRTLLVTKTEDTDDGACGVDCSLREALAAAQAGDEIQFASPLFDSPQTITLGGTPLAVTKNVAVTGKGANLLTVSGGGTSRVFSVSLGTATLSGMTITGGASDAEGGGVHNAGTLTLAGCHVTANTAGRGGGIFNAGTLTVTDSTVSSNTADATDAAGGIAGGIYNGGTLTLTNSTVSGNQATGTSADGAAGGVHLGGAQATATVTDSTVANNNATQGGSRAGGIYNGGAAATLRGSIVAGNRASGASPDLSGAFTTQGYNLVGQNDGAALSFPAPAQAGGPNQNNDLVGTSAQGLDPRLDALGQYGGTTPTHRLQPDSPAVDQGKAFGLTADQRGLPRPSDNSSVTNAGGGDGSDIGSFEIQQDAAGNAASLGGRVTFDGVPLGGVTLTLTRPGGSTSTTTTDAGGDYSFADLPAGSYTVTPSRPRFSFAPQSRTVALSGTNITEANFGAASTATNPQPANGPVLLSEFRLSGATSDDEFVELYNNTDADIDISGYALESLPGPGVTVPPNTVLPARSYYLIARAPAQGGGYTLSGYAAPDLTYDTFDLPEATGLVLLNPAGQIVDAVGVGTAAPPPYREGAPLAPVQTLGQHSFVRLLSAGLPADAGDNATDFILVSTDPEAAGAGALLGAPGPQNSHSPVLHNSRVKASLLDPCAPQHAAPNTVRDSSFSDPANNSTHGTFGIRRRFTNTTGGSVTRLRFRVVAATARTSAGAPPAGTADLRALSSPARPAVTIAGAGCAGEQQVAFEGLTLEELNLPRPSQPKGGGWNSTLAAGTITLEEPLGPGQSRNFEFLLGVEQTGFYRFFVNVEALTDVPGTPARKADVRTKKR